MARTQPPKGRNASTATLEQRYNRLPSSCYQLVCYKFWSFLEFEGEKGWDPEHVPNFVNNWRSSTYIKKHIRQGSFANIAKVR